MHDNEEARKIWVVEVSTFEYSHYSKELMHLLSVTLNLIRRFTKRQVPRGGVYGGLVILAHCKARYAVLLQIRTFPSKTEDEAHIGPTATYDEVIYPGFQHDITALKIQGYTSHT